MNKLKIPERIRNIIFDFGGVILNISHQKLENAFRLQGVQNFENLFNQAQQSELFVRFEKGLISPMEFRNNVRKLTGLNVSDESFDNAWNQIICDYPHRRIDLLKRIKKNYNLYLLSNTNLIHYDYYIEKFRIEFGFDLNSLFHNTYWSFKMGKRKPDAEAYTEIIRVEKLVPEETLFIDDSEQNIIAADAIGFKTLHLKKGMELTDLFYGSFITPD